MVVAIESSPERSLPRAIVVQTDWREPVVILHIDVGSQRADSTLIGAVDNFCKSHQLTHIADGIGSSIVARSLITTTVLAETVCLIAVSAAIGLNEAHLI